MAKVQRIKAPEWQIAEWLNTQAPIDLEAQRGRVVVACAFQMLCPGCVSQAIPQIKAIHETFSSEGVLVVGLHTVFEHHDAMTTTALLAFLHEYQIKFPVGVDQQSPSGAAIPQTMTAYRMRGTPTLLLIDRASNLRHQIFGHIADLKLGAEITRLVLESDQETSTSNA